MDGKFPERKPKQESGSVQRCLRARAKERNSHHEEHLSSEPVGSLATKVRELQFVHEWKSEHNVHRTSSIGVSIRKRVPRQTRRERIDHQGFGKQIPGKSSALSSQQVLTESAPKAVSEHVRLNADKPDTNRKIKQCAADFPREQEHRTNTNGSRRPGEGTGDKGGRGKRWWKR